MSLVLTGVRSNVRAWLDTHWNSSLRQPMTTVADWADCVFAAGWAVPSWSERCWGKGLDPAASTIVAEEFREVQAPWGAQDLSNIAACTIYQFGSESLKHDILPELLTGRKATCLLYSEPGAGSDLAAVRTRADRRDDDYVISGQKVWTSGAHKADYGLILVRTDWDATKHAGLSYMVVPMRQSGVEVRPIHQITGDHHFNEVFFDRAIAPAGNLLGSEGEGWKVLQLALAVERRVMGEGAGERRQGSVANNSIDLIQVAKDAGLLQNPVIRQDIATVTALRIVNAMNMERAKAESAPGASSPIMSLGKLSMSRILHEEARLLTRLLGSASILDDQASGPGADANYRAANAYMTSIGGGTDQIQRNIISERILGLPREIEVDREVPFRRSPTTGA